MNGAALPEMVALHAALRGSACVLIEEGDNYQLWSRPIIGTDDWIDIKITTTIEDEP